MNKRIRKTEADINQLPITQRQLGTIERKYQLNDALYNYLMQKHAEAKITSLQNSPNNAIIESAKLDNGLPISPNKRGNYVAAFLISLALPFGYLMTKNALNNKIQSQDDIERLTQAVPFLVKYCIINTNPTMYCLSFPNPTWLSRSDHFVPTLIFM